MEARSFYIFNQTYSEVTQLEYQSVLRFAYHATRAAATAP